MTEKKANIPVVVCEFHQEVLQYIHRLIGQKKIPFSGIKMIHFDSHPDLAFPDRLSADDCFCKEKMYYDLDIADWILPLMYAGHVNDLIWVKPPWADQIPEKNLAFAVGKDSESGNLRVTCKEDYFLEDCTFAPLSQLVNTQDINVESIELHSFIKKVKLKNKDGIKIAQEITTLDDTLNSSSCKRAIEGETIENHGKKRKTSNLKKLTNPDKFILDIDLDFFSVTNPFLQDYTEEQYQELKKAYEIEFPKCRDDEKVIETCVSDARLRLQLLKKTIDLVSTGASTVENKEHELFFNFLQLLKTQKNDIDWEMVHNAGMTTQLPHHISTENEIDDLVQEMVVLLKELPIPYAITVARSTVDEYSPPHQIELIQEKVLTALKLVYSDDCLDFNFDYKDDSRLL